MAKVRTTDTAPEMKIRSRLHAMGFRYRVDRRPERDVNTRADIVFGPAKVAVYVDGCFWHGCPEHGSLPRANRERWRAKLRRTGERDREVTARLERSGWRVIRIWEHEDPAKAAARIATTVGNSRSKGQVVA